MEWWTADLHFGHRNVIEYGKRPWKTTQEMNEALIANWNKYVKPKERINVVGDFSFLGTQNTTEILKRLNGYKILIKGNHDKPAHRMIEMGFQEVHENMQIKLGPHQIFVSHFPFHPVEQHYNVDGLVQTVLPEHADKRYLHKRILDDGKSFLIHGHVHTSWKVKGRQINVGCDVWDWRPISTEKILEIINGTISP